MPDDVYVLLINKDGSTVKQELYYGSTYLSQSSRTLMMNENVEKVEVTNSKGERRTLDNLPKAVN